MSKLLSWATGLVLLLSTTLSATPVFSPTQNQLGDFLRRDDIPWH